MPSASPATNLSSSPTSFVGRERELEQLASYVEAHRLVTVLGPPGTGKTRTSRTFGQRFGGPFAEGGVWFVDLTEAYTGEDLIAAVSDVLDAAPGGDEVVERVGEIIAGRGAVLLILDNFEQIEPSASSIVAAWLEQTERARFVVTSRRRLGLRGEFTFDLPPMDVDQAIELFEDRGRQVRHTFAVDEDNRQDVATIVEELDRLPLAIELAAARVNVMAPSALAERLADNRLKLRSPWRNVSPRQATLRGAIDWSWRLLSELEKDVLAQCAVFRGGFSLPAAEAILDTSAHDEDAWLLDLLEDLRDNSLLYSFQEPHLDELRFAQYKSLRDYCAEKLAERPQMDQAARARHADYYAEAAEGWAEAVRETGDVNALGHLSAESDNIIAVFKRFREKDPPRAIGAILHLHRLWATQKNFRATSEFTDDVVQVARAWGDPALLARALLACSHKHLSHAADPTDALQEVLAIAEGLEGLEAEEILANALVMKGHHAYNRGELERSTGHLRQALEIFEGLDDKAEQSSVLTAIGYNHLLWRDAEAAQSHIDQALKLARQIGHVWNEGYALCARGVLSERRRHTRQAIADYKAAAGCFEITRDRPMAASVAGNRAWLLVNAGQAKEALPIIEGTLRTYRELGMRRLHGGAHTQCAWAHLDLEDLEAATEHGHTALRLHSDVENPRWQGIDHGLLGLACCHSGDLEEAEGHFREAVAHLSSIDEPRRLAVFLAHLGAVHAARHDLEAAQPLIGRAREALADLQEPDRDLVVDLLEGALMAEAARRAQDAGDRVTAEAQRHGALKALQAAEDVDPELGHAPAGRSLMVRLAHRMASRYVEALTASLPDAPTPMSEEPDAPHLQIDRRCRWFITPDGERTDISRRRTIRTLLAGLIEQRLDHPGVGLSMYELIDVGWPDEIVDVDAGAKRVRTSIHTLRELGLRGLLLSDDGYYLDPDVPIVQVD